LCPHATGPALSLEAPCDIAAQEWSTLLHIPPDRPRGSSWRCGEGTPEMAKLRADPVTAAPRDKLSKNTGGIRGRHRRGTMAAKNKKARNLSVSGPLVRELGRACA